jgi:alpha-1,4-glucan:alpha-1,4-glucan 6-glycosyltransferase/4-alpha-glucanotransferase
MTGRLDDLARLYGVERTYADAFGRERTAPAEALLALLRGLGAEVDGDGDLAAAVSARRRELAGRVVEPVAVAWEGRLDLPLRQPADRPAAGPIPWHLDFHLELESGETRSGTLAPESSILHFEGDLPLGYHRLTLELPSAGGGTVPHEVLVIAAPRTTYGAEVHRHRAWGTFLPLYALRSERSWGVGDLGDLERLISHTRSKGGSVTGTLPIYSAFLGPEGSRSPFDPSPYAPASRLFWNELYLDFHEDDPSPELAACPEAKELLASAAFRQELARLRATPEVDYRGAMAAKRKVLQLLADTLFGGPHPGESEGLEARRAALEAHRKTHPELDTYAAFRAETERRGPWPTWKSADALPEADADDPAVRYHLYAQWRTRERLAEVAAQAARGVGGGLPGDLPGSGLYLDLPLGVHGAGYDAWRYGPHGGHLFVPGVGVGAPPDPIFAGGQGWGFPPVHPERQRESGYAYLRAVLRELLPVAGMLRIDHVMGLHRLFCIPDGAPPSDGAYVQYPQDEHYAILCLESHRAKTVLVGENLGVVPAEVNRALERHGIDRMWVAQFQACPDDRRPFDPPPRRVLACLDTHDTPTFPGWLEARDVDQRIEGGWLARDEGAEEKEARAEVREALAAHLRTEPDDSAALTRATLEHLAASPARTLLVNLEDLWGETQQQNEPGTGAERPNWQRKAVKTMSEIETDATVNDTLEAIDRERKSPDPTSSAKPSPRSLALPPKSLAPREDVGKIVVGEALRDVSPLTEDDLYLFNEGRHFRLYEKLGAHPMEVHEVPGTYFAVWAPGASTVSVIGDFNGWDPRAHPLQIRGASGIWEGFLPGVGPGALYKLHVVSGAGDHRVDKADPFAFRSEVPPKTGSVVWGRRPGEDEPVYAWGDGDWMASRGEKNALDAPVSIYEVHLGSWRRRPEEGDRPLTYREMAPLLADHVERQGFTHVELLPVMEHPFGGSWGYQTTGYFAPTSRFGTPEDLMYLVDHLHQRGIGVILDWVPSHFPTDQHGLAYFDGTHLFEHADPRQGFHPDWGSLIFNYGRHEVRSFLISSALFWLDRFHADGIRVDAVASMLYLDYSREAGEWVPNEYGGRENLEALAFLRQLNEAIYREYPDVHTFAEESTAWPMVSRPLYLGGLGFGYKWDMGWMHDTLQYMEREPVHRRHHHGELTFRMVYAFTENFTLPLSHDEVVHGKGSLVNKMPGDDWQRFANLRLLYAYLYAQPGKKLLFMGAELAQRREWDHDRSLDWHLLEHESHQGVARVVADLNRVYREEGALHELDCEGPGFEWLEANDAGQSVLAFVRRGRSTGDLIACVFNFTPVVRENYILGVPRGGRWEEILNTDASEYWGSGTGNLGGVEANPVPAHGRNRSVTLTLPPLGAVFLKNAG